MSSCALVNETYEDELREITCPVELVWGSDDTAAPVAVAERAVELLAHPSLDGVVRGRAPHSAHGTRLSSGLQSTDSSPRRPAARERGRGRGRHRRRRRLLASRLCGGSVSRNASTTWPDRRRGSRARWWRCTAANAALISVGIVALIVGFIWPPAGLAAAMVGLVGPLGLGVRGRTSKLAWTRRLRTLAVVSAIVAAVALLVGAIVDRLAATSAALGARRSRADRPRARAARAGRAPARLSLCGPGDRHPATHRSEGRRDHGLVRQDDDEAVRRATC